MVLRSWLSLCVVVAVTWLCGCSSPGTAFAYKDLKISIGPGASPAQPVIGQATTISFTLRNTWNQPLTGVAWELRETTSGSTVLDTGTVDLVAFGSSAQSFVITSPTAGTHTYEVVIDPANAVAEDDESNNTSSELTVLVADQDIAFGSPAPAVTWPSTPNTTDQATLTFVIANTVDTDQASPAANISVPFDITRNGAAFAFTATPTSPTTVNADGTTSVSVVLPATTSAGTFEYTITLSPADGDDNNTGNNTATVTVVIPASI